MNLISVCRSKPTTPADSVGRIASVAAVSNGMANLSRRRFIAAAGLGVATVCAPRLLFRQETGIVPTMINGAARAKIEVHALRRNISVLEGSGGNIAVLTGKGGKLLIDSGFTVSRVRIAAALNGLNSDPGRPLINTYWHGDSHTGN